MARAFVYSITITSGDPAGRIGSFSMDALAIADLPASGTPSSTTYLRGDGTWATPSGSGTVTSVGITAPAAGITVSGSPVTTSGSITLALANDLAALEALTGTNTIYYRSGTSTWTAVTIGANLSFSGGTLSATGSSTPVVSVSPGSSVSASVNTKYLVIGSIPVSLATITLPTTAAVGDQVIIRGASPGLWRLAQNSSQIIHGSSDTTTGTGGYLQAQAQYDCVTVECVVANLEWLIINQRGTLTVV